MFTKKFAVTNPTAQPLVVYDIGVFEPGRTERELSYQQVDLLKQNAILKVEAIETKESPAPTTTKAGKGKSK